MTDEEIQGLIEAHSVAWAVEFQKGNKEEARFFSDTAGALRQLQAENKALKEDAQWNERAWEWVETNLAEVHDGMPNPHDGLRPVTVITASGEQHTNDSIADVVDAALQQEKCDG